MSQIRRRQILLLGGVFLAAPIAAVAQQAGKVWRIGSLSPTVGYSSRDEDFKQALGDLGWIDGQNVKIEYRWAKGSMDRLPALAEELVRLNVDLIVAWTTPAASAAKMATQTIPIVMASIADPVGSHLIDSLARPAGNVTGVSLMAPELTGKRLELLREVVPGISRVAFLAQGGNTASELFVKEVLYAGQRLAIHIQPVFVMGPRDFENAFATMSKERVGGLIVQPIVMTGGNYGTEIAELAIRHRLPTISDGYQFADVGGLIYYGPDRRPLDRLVATYADKILRGAKPAELPVAQPQIFQLVINRQTARRLRLNIPQSVLARADKLLQ